MTDNNLAHLCPVMQEKYKQWLQNCISAGLNVRSTITYRNSSDQDAAKAKGLSNACAGQSPHNCTDGCDAEGNPIPASAAFDFGVFNDDGSLEQNGMDSRYTQAAKVGKDLGLVWGGDWRHPDYDHLELPNWKDLS